MNIRLERFAYSPMGTFGTLWLPDNELVYTVERPWLNNEPRISCIPEGVYECIPRRYNRGGYDAVHITNVPNRSLILIHKGNTMHNVEGCVAVGAHLGSLEGTWAVLNSANAFTMVMQWANQQFDRDGKFTLDICRQPYSYDI